ncbi:MAG TPA: hypothetical protein VG076_00500 [Acidimicrobiales bacterium]|jgi:hypothetical protein|nr:hypothetical protein [Acidimicrobiales bacterium]
MARAVRLIGVPVDLYLEATRHMGEIAREFALISFGERSGVNERVPAQLLELVGDLRGRFRGDTDAIRAQVEAAARDGKDTVEIELPADETAAEITERITDLLDAADEFCRSGDLLTLAAPPQVVAWRHWWRDQVVGQVREGAEPMPWTPVTQP